MNAIFVSTVGLGFLFFVIIFGLAYVLIGKPRITKRLQPDNLTDVNKTKGDWLKRIDKLFKPLGEIIPRPPEEMSRQERRMIAAGIRRKDAAVLLNGAKVSLIVLALCVFAVTGLLWKNVLLFALLSILIGAMIPDLWLKSRINGRADRIQLALPNALDLAVVCVEAGMGLDQALMRIGQEMKKSFAELSDELHVLGLEINSGRKRVDALRNLGARSESKDLKSFTAVLIQTDRFGTSIAQSLRTYSDSMRTTRRLRAEERAAKMSIKMMPPLVFFIFPAMLIVMLGPAVIAVVRELLPMMAGK